MSHWLGPIDATQTASWCCDEHGIEYWLHPMPEGTAVAVSEERGGWCYRLTAGGRACDSGPLHELDSAGAMKAAEDAARSWFMEAGRNDAAEAIPQ